MEENFEELLKQSEERTVLRVTAGQKLEGTIVTISRDVAYVDIGMRSEVALPFIADDERFEALVEGQTLTVYVARTKGDLQLGLDPLLGHGDFGALEEAFDKGENIEGMINKCSSGGYEVNIGGVRCFCPRSQLAMRGSGDGGDPTGQTFTFRIIELESDSKNVVLSRRVLQEEEQAARLAEVRVKIVPNAVLKGNVCDIRPFGAFVDLGGIQGLLHISELAYHNVARVEDVLNIGDEVEIKILDISLEDSGKERISLSRKALLANPWDSLAYSRGDLIQGTVARISKFGVFINLAVGIDGLLPRRMMKKAGRDVAMEDFEEGTSIEVEVVEINRGEGKIALALPGWDDEIKSNLKPGETLKVEVVKVLPVGVIVQGVEDSARGLLHKRHLKEQSMKQILQNYALGSQHEVVLRDVDELGRFNFALKGVGDMVDAETMSRFTEDKGKLGHNPFAAFFNKK